MQYFGTIETKYDEIFLTESYMYFNAEDEEITVKELKEKIKTAKDRKKNKDLKQLEIRLEKNPSKIEAIKKKIAAKIKKEKNNQNEDW